MAKETTEGNIPIIDMSQDEAVVVKELMKAFTGIGFATLRNHGAEPGKIQRAFAASKQFFALSPEIKQKYKFQGHESNRGYIGIGLETHDLEVDCPADHKETFDIGKDNEPGYQNLWPTELEESTTADSNFRQHLLEYFQMMDQLYLRLMRMIEIGLELPQDFLVQRCNGQHENLRLLHYPSLDKPSIRGNIHTDFGTLTLLVQDQVGGLKVRRKDGSWIDVKPIQDAVIVNVGDMLMRWSNDHFKATLHQVVPPPGGSAIPERFSIAFFCNANKDTTIECLDSCINGDSSPKYPPINAHEYLTQRLMDTINNSAQS